MFQVLVQNEEPSNVLPEFHKLTSYRPEEHTLFGPRPQQIIFSALEG